MSDLTITEFYPGIFKKEIWWGLTIKNTIGDDQGFYHDALVFEDMIKTTRPKVIIEVGTWKGHSANGMADICVKEGIPEVKIICIDTFLGSVEHYTNTEWNTDLCCQNGRPTLWERFLGNTVRRGNQSRIFPLPLPALTAAQVLSHFGVKADLIYLDAGHEYEDIKFEIDTYYKFLNTGGMIFGDDYAGSAGVRRAVHEFANARGLRVYTLGLKWIVAGGMRAVFEVSATGVPGGTYSYIAAFP